MSLSRLVGIGWSILLVSGTVSATTWIVDQSSGGCSDSSCAPCCTIQGAVFKSSGDDTISVQPGTYPESVDFRDMWSVGDITLEAAMGPDTVFVTSPSDHTIRHGSGYINTVTIDGLNVGSVTGKACVYLDHAGNTLLVDVTADNCGYTAFVLDNTGSVNMYRCGATSSAGTGIQIDGSSGAYLEDCTTNSNGSHGVSIAGVPYTVHLVNPTSTDNTDQGLDFDISGFLVIQGGTVTGNGGAGIWAWATGAVGISDVAVGANDEDGILIEWNGVDPVDQVSLTNVSSNGNGAVYGSGIEIERVAGATEITGCEANNNGLSGLGLDVDGTIEIVGSTFTGNGHQGVDIGWDSAASGGDVSMTNAVVVGNGTASHESGVRIRNTVGAVTITGSSFDNNADAGLSMETSVVGDATISGGHANGNGNNGYDLRVVGNSTITGVAAGGNSDKGISIDSQGLVRVEDSIASANLNGSGISVDWQDPAFVDGVSVIDCTANSNGLMSGGNGVYIRHVTGDVTVVGSTTNGNSRTGVRIDDVDGSAFVGEVVSNDGLEEGIKIDADIGPVIIVDSTTDGNALEGIKITSDTIELEEVTLKRNLMTDNGGTGMAFIGFGDTGSFKARCNDIAGNSHGLYLDGDVTIDARAVWWGNPTGPSGQGPGSGDAIYAEPGGSIDYTPWLDESFTSPTSVCPFFTSGFENGSLAEWDH